MNGNFNTKFKYLTDVLDRYSNMIADGHELSVNQKAQVSEILDWLKEHNANDSDVMDVYIRLASGMLSENKTYNKNRNMNLSELHLKKIIRESVKSVLNEGQFDDNPVKKWVY